MEAVVDVIIPTFKPGEEFLRLIEKLQRQSLPVNRIILMNTEEKYFERLRDHGKPVREYRNVEVHHISQREFDHGNTRNQGIKRSDAPYFICMTQDAVPADGYLIERLLEPLLKGEAAVSYARQLPKPDCGPAERYTKEFNYPKESGLKGWEDVKTLGIKAFFCSNACAAYRRDTFDRLGGFIRRTIFNEDMIYAFGALKAGERIAYAAQARVFHSHNYTWKQEFCRNFDLGVSQADHPEVFGGIRSESEGIRLVRQTLRYLKETGNGKRIPGMLWKSGWKYLGYRLGRHYYRLPRALAVKCSMNRNYWRE